MSKFACNENGLSKKSRLLFALAVVVSLCFGYGHCWEQDLMLNVNVRDDYLVVGALGWFPIPSVYYKVLDYPYAHRYAAIEKDFEEDPGRLLWAVYYPFPRYMYSALVATPDSVYVDGKGDFLSMEGEGDLGVIPPRDLKLPAEGDSLATLSPNSMRRIWRGDAAIAPLSAFDVIVSTLIRVREAYADRWDADRITLCIDGSFFRQNRFHELTPLITALKEIGFKYVWVDVYELDEAFRISAMEWAHQEIYRLSGLERPKINPSGDLRLVETRPSIMEETVRKKISKKFSDKFFTESAGRMKDYKAKAFGWVEFLWTKDVKVRGSRSAEDVAETMRQRSPGLEHIYNKFLKKKPRFKGRVVLRFEIAPSGEVARPTVAYSSTGYEEFDNAIRDYVGQMTFGEVESGNAKVTIPLTFGFSIL
ncbi:TonB family protein [Fibrobacter sp. UWB11]|uniref:TonB family protein n=1 Tax=Fibrobacter sp. UWB11 TaxID=1896202 RepID=UPI0009295474|nr:TonB family protein [Fibrobacter sp. UWB11]SIO32668.1 TonB family C-terminal domain-containing protein [Fibrobacter sp. UWB11]